MNFLIVATNTIVTGSFSDAMAAANGSFFVKVNEQGNSCIYNGDAAGHSKGFCTARSCY